MQSRTSADLEQRFKALIENSADALLLIDAAGKVLYESPSYKRIILNSAVGRE